MSIRLRIALLVLSVFLSLAAIGGFAIHRSQLSASQVRNVTTGVVPDAIESITLMGQLKDVQIATLAMVNETEPSAIEKRHREIATRKETLQTSLKNLADHASTQAEKGLSQQALEGMANYFQSIDDTAQLALNGQREIAEANLAGTVDQYLREEGEIMQTLQVERTRSKDEAIASLNAMLGKTTVTLGMATLLTVLASALIGWLLQRQVVRPIAAMERRMTDIATHHDYSLRMPVERQDEIGRSVIAFNTMLGKIQESAAEVRAKNANIRAMLQALPEGILTLESGGRIQPEYSAHLCTLLGDRDYAGMSVMEAVFADSQLSDDERAGLDAAIGACIGEDEMNFAFNAHLLPAEIHWQPAGAAEAKILQMHWEPMPDEQGMIEKILLTLRDVTEMRALARAAAQQAQELTMISEILALPATGFSDFLAQTGPDLDRLQALLAQARGQQAEPQVLILQLFRLMHTIKGNARTLGLRTLANTAHRAEDSYDRWRQGTEPMDLDRALTELAAVRELVDTYRHLHEDRLGRRATEATAALSRAGLKRLGELVRTAHDHANPHTAPQAHSALEEMQQILARAECQTLAELIAPLQAGLPDLARQLDKPAPELALEGGELLLRSPAQKVLTNVFNHLLRNALDHGLESAADRHGRDKPERGQIRLSAQLGQPHLVLTLDDDGRGLNLDRIRDQALAQGLLREEDAASAATIAQCIFAGGFSTAAQVTDVSGRGVGMDAVKADIESLGGTIALELDPASPAHGFAAFRTVIQLPAPLALPGRPAGSRTAQAAQAVRDGEQHHAV